MKFNIISDKDLIMNKKNKISLIITTINKPNRAIDKYLVLSKKNKINFIIIGDKKSPNYQKKYPFYDLKKQKKLNFKLYKYLPQNSYSRKNLGYLMAMKSNSKVIIETDDDNFPKNNFFNNINLKKNIIELSGPKWINILKVFTKENIVIWPRGFPLKLINKIHRIKTGRKNVFSPIQQRMCDGNPDVDAIYRLTNNFKNFRFKNRNIAINNKSICPFNSQNTVWYEVAFPLLYLPSFCTMRSTDIWRSFVASKIIRNYNWNLTFLKSTVVQKRNIHDLMDDFIQEIPVYKNTINFNKTLEKINLSKKYEDILINIHKCYEELIYKKILNKNELPLLKNWLDDVQKIYPNLKKYNK